MHLKTLSVREFRKHTTQLDLKNCRLTLNRHFVNRCSDTSDYYKGERNRNGVGLAHFILSSATKEAGQRMLSRPIQTGWGRGFSWPHGQCVSCTHSETYMEKINGGNNSCLLPCLLVPARAT